MYNLMSGQFYSFICSLVFMGHTDKESCKPGQCHLDGTILKGALIQLRISFMDHIPYSVIPFDDASPMPPRTSRFLRVALALASDDIGHVSP